ncbi:hypothetical protein HK096_011363, partial [Nowakowskiella sp. JEL0078]
NIEKDSLLEYQIQEKKEARKEARKEAHKIKKAKKASLTEINEKSGNSKRAIELEEMQNNCKRKKIDEDFTMNDASDFDKISVSKDKISFYVIDNLNAGNIVRITNVPAMLDEQMVRELFQVCGEIVEVIINHSEVDDLSVPAIKEIFVEFSDVNGVKQACDICHNVEIAGYFIVVERCRPKQSVWSFNQGKETNKIFVKNFTKIMDKKKFRALFSPFGDLKEIRFGNNGRFAYVEFKESGAAI